MDQQWLSVIHTASTWVIPAILAITLHEAAHGFVARWCGDDTAWRLGRVSLNPFKHIDPFGTIVLPGLLLLMRAPFLFGYAKPVPVNFAALRNPRRDMIWVAAAGPATNLLMAVAAALLVHLAGLLPPTAQLWLLENLENALVLNVMLAAFNMIPLPPLDGGRVLLGLLPAPLAAPFSRLERHGMLILIGLLFILPLVGAQLGRDLNIVGWLLRGPVDAVIEAILRVTGNG